MRWRELSLEVATMESSKGQTLLVTVGIASVLQTWGKDRVNSLVGLVRVNFLTRVGVLTSDSEAPERGTSAHGDGDLELKACRG